jgi:hypothetical protein
MPIIAEAQQQGVFIWTFRGFIADDELGQWFETVTQLTAASQEAKVYHLMDVRDGESDFPAVRALMRRAAQVRLDLLYPDRLIKFVVIGTKPIVQFAVTLGEQERFGNFDIPIFLTMENAYDYIRSRRDLPNPPKEATV